MLMPTAQPWKRLPYITKTSHKSKIKDHVHMTQLDRRLLLWYKGDIGALLIED